MADLGRRDPRFEVRLEVGIGVFQPEVVCHTLDVSRTGMRLEGAPPLKAGQMVWMHIHLPQQLSVEATGVVRSPSGGGRGVGVEFSMFMHGAHGTWEDFLHSLEWSNSGGKVGKERRRWPREDSLSFVVYGAGQEWRTGDTSLGGLFLAAQELLPRGTELKLKLVHPDTEQAFSVRARVVRLQTGERDTVRGMGLHFLGLDQESLQALQRFIDWGDSAPISADRSGTDAATQT